jgi:hypothetical protein
MPDLASDNPIAIYRARLSATPLPFVLARRFVAADRWTEATTEGGRYWGMFREREPDLPAVLQHRRILILGEPGAGKSTAADAIVHHLLTNADPTEAPLRAALRSYRGNLRSLLLGVAPAEVLDARPAKRTYVLDGIDEVASDARDALRRELGELIAADDARIVLTSRQAFYAQHRSSFPDGFTSFHLLDFDDRDIRAYARHRAVDPDAFLEAAYEIECDDLIHNPFLLTVMLDYYLAHGSLGRTRSENVEFAVNQLIRSRVLFHEVRQRRALRMLAVACETAARNELTEDEALLVLQESMDLGSETAKQLLDELSHSILLRTAGGISFQMRSFGEYLAAEELHDKTIDRLKELAFVRETPIDTWANAISYLAELNPKVRGYVSLRHPELLISASPAAFTLDERTALARQLLRNFNAAEIYLVSQELISIRRLSRLLTPVALAELRAVLESPRGHEVGNALVLLAIHHDAAVVPLALRLATEHRNASPLRHAAIVALINADDHGVLETLRAFYDPTDVYHLSILDAIGSLCTPTDFTNVLPLLERSNAGLSAAFYHFRELTTIEALIAAIDYLTANPACLHGYQLDSYLEPIIDFIPAYWDDSIAERLGHLLAAFEHAQIHRSKLAERIITHLAHCDQNAVAIRVLVADMNGAPIEFIDDLIARPLITETAAQWIHEHAPAYASRLASWLPPGPPRDLLAPQTPDMTRAQQEATAQYRAAQQQEEQAAKTARDQHQVTIRTARDINAILAACVNLRKEHWPDIAPDQRRWLADQVSISLIDADLGHSVRWLGDNQWTHPRNLEPLLDLTSYYELRLTNDVPVILALKSWPYESISNYYRREGLTTEAAICVTDLLQERENDNITSHVFTFLRTTGYNTTAVQGQLINLALDTARSSNIRRGAMERLDAQEPALTALRTITADPEESIRAQAIRDLITRHDEAVTAERLSALTDDDLRAGDVPFPRDSPLDWIANVTAPFAIGELIRLRRRALELTLWRTASLIMAAVAKTDKNRAAAIISRQLSDTPPAWRQHLAEEAEKLRRAARVEAAQQSPFDLVIKKLKGATSMLRIKVWCEGPTDRPIFEKLFTELGETEIAESIDYVAGWPMLVSENKPERWYDGCRQAIIIMDGDRGRKLHLSSRPLSSEAKAVEKRFKTHPLTLHVLHRYGIENYFPRHAVQKVLGRDLSAYFPIPPNKKIEKHFRDPWWRRLLNRLRGQKTTSFFAKNLNEQIAQELTMTDIQETDLADVLAAVKKVAEQARQY